MSVGIGSTVTPGFEEYKKTLPQEPVGNVKKKYVVIAKSPRDWTSIHEILLKDGTLEDNIPNHSVECADPKSHSNTRGTYLLTQTEVDDLKKHSKVESVTIDAASYPGTYMPDPALLQDVIIQDPRYSTPVRNYRSSASSNLPSSPGAAELNRAGYQLLRSKQKINVWQGSPSTVINNALGSYSTGRDVDCVVADQAAWLGHIEFQNNLGGPIDYIGGNTLTNKGISATTGTCDVLDLVLDAPYYIDPDYFNADPGTRLTQRWDGTTVPIESVALGWWADSAKRSATFSSMGTVDVVSTGYTRDRCNGRNNAYHSAGSSNYHGTPCASQVYGRNYGYAFNSNKWYINAYGTYGTGVEKYFDILKLFHLYKPINTTKASRDPTVSSNSFGYRKDLPNQAYYFFRNGTSGHLEVSYSADVTASSGGGSPSNYSISVTNSGASAYVLNGTDSNGSVSGNNATINCAAGDTINFNVSVSGHPFWIKTVSQTGTSGGASGVTNNGAQSGTVSFTPSTAGTYYYICQYHGGMVGTINVASSGGGLVYALSGTDKAGSISGNNPTITMNAYDTITFNVNASGHPFYVKTLAGTGSSNQAAGVTNNGAQVGTVTFKPTASGTYYYNCEFHGSMQGTINVGSPNVAGVQYSSLPPFLSYFAQSAIRFEYVGNSMVTAGNELIDAGVIFVCSAGNTNQKLVKYDHPDYDNYWATGPDTAYSAATTVAWGYDSYNSISRQGFPGQIGQQTDSVAGITTYRTIPVGALDDGMYSTSGTGIERKVYYSNNGNLIPFYACADSTLAACDNNWPGTNYNRYDAYYTLNGVQSVESEDALFSGTSSACPIACGIIATKLEVNRDWEYTDVLSWVTNSVGTLSASEMYPGTDGSSPTTASDWNDSYSLQGGEPIIIWDALTGNEEEDGSPLISLRLKNANGLKLSGINFINT